MNYSLGIPHSQRQKLDPRLNVGGFIDRGDELKILNRLPNCQGYLFTEYQPGEDLASQVAVASFPKQIDRLTEYNATQC